VGTRWKDQRELRGELHASDTAYSVAYHALPATLLDDTASASLTYFALPANLPDEINDRTTLTRAPVVSDGHILHLQCAEFPRSQYCFESDRKQG
jgi:hypothetical protein